MFELIVISHAAMLPGEAAIIHQLFEEGLEYFHLRKPEADEQAVCALIEAIPAEYHNRIVMHGFFELMSAYGMRRWHFREQQRETTPVEKLTQLKGKGYILSTSVHDLPTLQQLPSLFSYAFFSPVFDSISKQGYKGVVQDGFLIGNEERSVRVIALGGVDAGNIQKVVDMKFDGAAVLGAIWHSPANAIDNFKLLQKKIR